MFKNYLSYEFALNFDRNCSTLELPEPEKNELLRCSRQMVQYFTRALYAKNDSDRCRHLFVALTYLRDCKEVLDHLRNTAGLKPEEALRYYAIVHERLEQLCLDASDSEQGQIRMLG